MGSSIGISQHQRCTTPDRRASSLPASRSAQSGGASGGGVGGASGGGGGICGGTTHWHALYVPVPVLATLQPSTVIGFAATSERRRRVEGQPHTSVTMKVVPTAVPVW